MMRIPAKPRYREHGEYRGDEKQSAQCLDYYTSALILILSSFFKSF